MTRGKWFPRPEGELTGLFEPYLRAARVEFNDEVIAASDAVMLLRDGKSQGYIHYMFAAPEVEVDWLEETGSLERTEKGDVQRWDVVVGDRRASRAAFTYPNEPLDERPDVRGYFGFDWTAMDAWYEEGHRVYGHPRDPYNRVDTVASDRAMRVALDGETLAETDRATFLFETGHPRRYYFPKADVAMDSLTPTNATWRCPYKGQAKFWNVEIGGETYENYAWSYPETLKDAAEVEGMIGFYNEKLDIYVDGELEGKPTTRFSSVGELGMDEIKEIAERDVVQ